MKVRDEQYEAYVSLLKKELVPAMGCTEPIAIAYGAALAKKLLEEEVESVDIYASGNIIKNVKSVTVPNTRGHKGIEAAAAIGIVAGNSDLNLEVIREVCPEQVERMEAFLGKGKVRIYKADTKCALEIAIEAFSKHHRVKLCIQNEHSNVVYIEKDGVCIVDKKPDQLMDESWEQMSFSMEGIYEFVKIADIDDVKEVLDRQIAYNTAIAEEGLRHSYGANIGSVLLSTYGDRVEIRARAMAAAGSDARMGGCELPVVINSGSGNQGMCASLPVLEYAKELGSDQDTLYRALLIANLTTLYQKKHIGRLSAYCGAVSAGAGAGAGIAYLLDQDYDHICHAIVNALAITSGMICDGAKPSCAAKIASAVDAGIIGCMMYQKGTQFCRGEGIVSQNIESTIDNVGQLAREGMRETDDEIIRMMMQEA